MTEAGHAPGSTLGHDGWTVPPDAPCPFCALPPDQLLLANDQAASFRDRTPLSEGHTLVVPRRHVTSVFELNQQEQAALWSLVADVRARLLEELGPEGFTIGVNDGLAAGQTVPHAHVHVIPRRWGDVAEPKGGVRWIIPDRAVYW